MLYSLLLSCLVVSAYSQAFHGRMSKPQPQFKQQRFYRQPMRILQTDVQKTMPPVVYQQPMRIVETDVQKTIAPVVHQQKEVFDVKSPVIHQQKEVFDQKTPVIHQQKEVFDLKSPVIHQQKEVFDQKTPAIHQQKEVLDQEPIVPVVHQQQEVLDQEPIVPDVHQQQEVLDQKPLQVEETPLRDLEPTQVKSEAPKTIAQTPVLQTNEQIPMTFDTKGSSNAGQIPFYRKRAQAQLELPDSPPPLLDLPAGGDLDVDTGF